MRAVCSRVCAGQQVKISRATPPGRSSPSSSLLSRSRSSSSSSTSTSRSAVSVSKSSNTLHRVRGSMTKMPENRIGFIGMGIMGAPMAKNLIKGGYEVVVWNRSADKCKPLQDVGAVIGMCL